MKINPVYKREVMMSSRSVRLPLILLAFNSILAVAALLSMYTAINQVKLTAQMQYSSFLELYLFVTTIEFTLLLFLIPANTAGSISGERERQTLDLMLTTQMTAFSIVTGKLMASLTTMFMLIVSSFPILSLVFVYGGVTIYDLFLLLICYITTAFLVGSLGTCLSALLKRSVLSTAFSYLGLALLVLGTYGLNYFVMTMNQNGDHGGGSYGFVYLLLINPAATFYTVVNEQIGNILPANHVSQWFGAQAWSPVFQFWIVISIVLQLLLSGILLAIAVRVLHPSGKKALQLT